MYHLSDISADFLSHYLNRFQLIYTPVANKMPISGSYWGEPEAGLIKNRIYARADTPLHSLLHEACHYICMDQSRRNTLHTDAGGRTPAEENAVCYLQILLADDFANVGRKQILEDMDEWGYSFRLGSAQKWFEQDADDARQWLIDYQLIDANSTVLYRINSVSEL
jgi:hypothetical protein